MTGHRGVSRRRFLGALGAAAAVVAFDPLNRRWLTAADAASGDPIPSLDGELVMSDGALDAASVDSGFMVSRRPWAVLRPGSVRDVARMVSYCGKHRIRVAGRGAGHSVFGQPLVDDGLVVDMDTLAKADRVGPRTADVGAGMRWAKLLDLSLAKGLTPPLFTGYIDLSLGGTLSVGGVSTLNREGAQVDRARALEIVTGEGRIVRCSETDNRDLFEAALGGFGQFGIITRAVVDLVRAPRMVRHWALSYMDPHTFFHDFWLVIERGEADQVWGQIAPPMSPTTQDASPARTLANAGLFGILQPLLSPLMRIALEPGGPVIGTLTNQAPNGQWVYQLNVTKHYDDDAPSDGLIRDTQDVLPLRHMSDQTWRDYVLNVDALVDVLKTFGLWYDVPHPWIDNFLPGKAAERFVADTLAELNFEDLGAAGLILVFAMQRSKLTRPSFVMPSADPKWVVLFDVLTSAPGPGPNSDFVAEKLARNRTIYERARAAGGKLYPISAVPMRTDDWKQHYGARYADLLQLKAAHDPDGIMGANLGIF